MRFILGAICILVTSCSFVRARPAYSDVNLGVGWCGTAKQPPDTTCLAKADFMPQPTVADVDKSDATWKCCKIDGYSPVLMRPKDPAEQKANSTACTMCGGEKGTAVDKKTCYPAKGCLSGSSNSSSLNLSTSHGS